MLRITIPAHEAYDEKNDEFIYTKEISLSLEHSLVSISKWESKWKKPFLDSEKSNSEIIDYIKCMTITQNVDDSIYKYLTQENVEEIKTYIDDAHTATWFNKQKDNKPVRKEIITSEIIYYWMISFNIPFECQRWHLNRLLTLIRVCGVKNTPAKKMGKRETLARNKSLNDARRKMMGSKG